MELLTDQACFGGAQRTYRHASTATGSPMRFGVYLPPTALAGEKRPALYYLPGLTCTEETFFIKAGAQRLAAELGLVLVSCDTSPRGLDLPGDSASWDFGVGAGFYLDATQAPWAANYRMATYVGEELPALVEATLPVRPDRRGLFGHSMGGHGALVTALRNPTRWHSLSALAPIANPVAVPWGEKAFGNYLGADCSAWAEWDASLLLAERGWQSGEVLVDQGLADQFLDGQLRPDALEAAAERSGARLRLRRHAGYDHGYYFVQTFMADHLAHHARLLLA